eukprot:4829033-Prymnesium_polylepis.1
MRFALRCPQTWPDPEQSTLRSWSPPPSTGREGFRAVDEADEGKVFRGAPPRKHAPGRTWGLTAAWYGH